MTHWLRYYHTDRQPRAFKRGVPITINPEAQDARRDARAVRNAEIYRLHAAGVLRKDMCELRSPAPRWASAAAPSGAC